MALDTFNPYLFVSAGEQSNKFLTPTYADGIAQFQAQRTQSLTGLTVRIDPIQEGTGDPSPENIRPISGRTGMTVTRNGKNLLPPPVDGTYTGNGITAVVSGGKITLSGTTTATGNAIIIPLSQPVSVPVGSYVHLLNTAANASIPASFESSSDIAGTNFGVSCAPVNRIIATTKTEVVTWDRIRFYLGNGVATNLSLSPMLCLTSDYSEYTPYVAPTTYPVTWESSAGTVYGGTLDVVSGVLTATHAYWTKNTATMNNNENYPGWIESGVRAIVGGGISAVNRYVGNIGTVIAINTNATNDIAYLSKGSYNGMNQSQWKELAIDVEFVLPLATPQTYQLSPADVKTLPGFNQVYSDAGPVIDIKF